MRLFKAFKRAFARFRYPVSLPEEIAQALGITLTNCLSYQELLTALSSPTSAPTKLSRFMPREHAEKVFSNAIKLERFTEKTLISYYFSEGWLEFILQFDRDSRLRRIYLLHREIMSDQGVELPLST